MDGPVKIIVNRESEVAQSYRAERARGLFNVHQRDGSEFHLEADIPIEQEGWQVGVVVGASGTGKSSLGQELTGKGWREWTGGTWGQKTVLDDVGGKSFDEATGVLSQVGLGSVPAWLRPYAVLSNGEKFRADLAQLLLQRNGEDYVIDEFTSVLDRTVAQIGAAAFVKTWRKGPGRLILLTCHHDILDWVQPDWILDTATKELAWGAPNPKPTIRLTVEETGWSYWNSTFKRWHYLDLGPMPFSTAFVGWVGNEPVAHLGMSAMVAGSKRQARACRMVVMPEWQGAGVGTQFLNALCERELIGEGFVGKQVHTYFHTNHPGLAFVLRRSPLWRQVSTRLYGGGENDGTWGWGKHLRAVQGFKYYGERGRSDQSGNNRS